MHSLPNWGPHAMRLLAQLAAVLVVPIATGAAMEQPKVTTHHALSLMDAPKYGPDFTQLDYVNPNAPKGGELRLMDIGGFDSLNPYIIKGEPAPGISQIYQSL